MDRLGEVGVGFLDAGELYSVLAALAWAVAVILFRKSGEQVGPVVLNLYKNVVGFLLFLSTLFVLGVPRFVQGVETADWVVLLASGALGIGIADTAFFASLNRLGAGRSAIVDCLYSPFVVLCGSLYLQERPGPAVLGSMALMVAAIFVGTWSPAAAPPGERGAGIREGVLLGVLSMLLMAVGIVWAKPVLDRTDPLFATTVRLMGGLAFLGLQILAPRHRRGLQHAFRPGRHQALLLPTAIIGTYLAMFVWIAGMKYAKTSVASVLNQSSNVLVLLLAAAFLREAITPRKLVAIGLAFSGTLLVTL